MRSGVELLEIQLLDNHLLDTFGSKSTARLNWIRAVDKKSDKW
jgi:hypothetical protein